jgi:tetratricopeptide (TPR) repeat protein
VRSVARRPAVLALLAAAACSHEKEPPAGGSAPAPTMTTRTDPAAPPAPVADPAFRFVDCSAECGVAFTQYCGATGEYFDPETMAGGGGFLDADGDGDLDLFLVNGCSFPPKTGDPTHAFLRNDGRGRFTDATKEAGLAVVQRGMDCVAADVENDGDQDLLVTGVGRTLLFLNRGDGTFDEVSERAGIPAGGWTTAAAFFDYDGDGVLDLLLGRYVLWSEAIDRKLTEEKRCTYARGTRDYCPVLAYSADHLVLLHGRGDATFEDVTRAAGLADATCKALGMLVVDADDDGRPDVMVANDTLPTQLFRNRGDGTFVDVGLECGLALDHWGRSSAGMGVAADFTGDGALGIAIGNFSGEAITYHRQQRDAAGRLACDFTELSAKNGLRRPTLKDVTFGVVFADFDRDGDDDLAVSNGHVGRMGESDGVPYAQPARIFRRDGETFTEIALARDGLGAPVVGRGLAAGDFDGDGDVDLLQLVNQGRARLFRNEGAAPGARPHASLQVLLRGGAGTNAAARAGASNRDGVGARVKVSAGGRLQQKRRITGDSYLSMSDPALTFGLGEAPAADEVEVLWPSGRRDRWTNVPAGRFTAVEGESGAASVAPVPAPAHPAPPSLDALSFAELERLSKERPEELPLLKALGVRALRELRLDVAQRALDRAVELAPDDPAANWQQLRVVSMRADATALRARVAALFDRFGFDVMTLSAWSYLAGEGADVAAAAVLDEALARRPDAAALHAQKAAGALAQKRTAEALAEFKRAVELDPTDGRSSVTIAWIELSGGDAAGAEKAARAALVREPGAVDALRLLAQALHAQKRDDEAPRAYEQRLAQAPDDLAVRAELVLLLQELGRGAAVEAQLREIVARHPRDVRAWRVVLDARLEAADAAPLAAAAEQALAACGDDPDVLVRCARAELRIGRRRDVARALVERALQKDPAHAEALALRAELRP